LGARLLLSLLTHLLRHSAQRSLLAGWLLTHLPLLRCNHARLLGRSILRRWPPLNTLLRRLWSHLLLLLRVAHGWRPLYFSLSALFALRLNLCLSGGVPLLL
jgi:hypothetical protein